jgi:hypothetical protein
VEIFTSGGKVIFFKFTAPWKVDVKFKVNPDPELGILTYSKAVAFIKVWVKFTRPVEEAKGGISTESKFLHPLKVALKD